MALAVRFHATWARQSDDDGLVCSRRIREAAGPLLLRRAAPHLARAGCIRRVRNVVRSATRGANMSKLYLAGNTPGAPRPPWPAPGATSWAVSYG